MRIVILMIFVFCSTICVGQSKHELEPCGTPGHKSEWLKQYQANKENYPKSVGAEVFVPLNVAIVGKDNGSGLFSATTMMESLCGLTNDFSETEIVFYLHTYRNIFDSEFFEHASVLDGAEKMFLYDSEDAINNYIVGNPAGNCGYNLPYAGIALSTSCANPGDHTWAHELGHQFSLPHPFIGWEGGAGYMGEISHVFTDPAPETVLYNYTNFQDTLILDTLIIDTAYVELVDGSNCDIAADGFCDTKPDYISNRWPCDSGNNSFAYQTDPTGAQFNSDGTLFMSYSFDACASRFSDEQILAMRASLEEEDSEIISDVTASTGEIDGNGGIELYTPYDEGLDFEDIMFSWSEVEHADYYLLQILTANGTVFYDALVTTESAWVEELSSVFTFNWTVTPFNSTNFCNPVSAEVIEVTPTDVTSISTEISNEEVRLIPNVLTDNTEMRIESALKFDSFAVYSLDGRLIQTAEINGHIIDLENTLDVGIYFVKLNQGKRQVTLKFVQQ